MLTRLLFRFSAEGFATLCITIGNMLHSLLQQIAKLLAIIPSHLPDSLGFFTRFLTHIERYVKSEVTLFFVLNHYILLIHLYVSLPAHKNLLWMCVGVTRKTRMAAVQTNSVGGVATSDQM